MNIFLHFNEELNYPSQFNPKITHNLARRVFFSLHDTKLACQKLNIQKPFQQLK